MANLSRKNITDRNDKERERSNSNHYQTKSEYNKHLENLKNQRSRLEEANQSKYNYSISANDFENEKIKHEFYTLKSDNILYKEEINILQEKNQKLEDDLKSQHNRK